MATKKKSVLTQIPAWAWLVAGGVGFYVFIWPRLNVHPVAPYLGAIYPPPPQGSIPPPAATLQGSSALISSPGTTRR